MRRIVSGNRKGIFQASLDFQGYVFEGSALELFQKFSAYLCVCCYFFSVYRNNSEHFQKGGGGILTSSLGQGNSSFTVTFINEIRI